VYVSQLTPSRHVDSPADAPAAAVPSQADAGAYRIDCSGRWVGRDRPSLCRTKEERRADSDYEHGEENPT